MELKSSRMRFGNNIVDFKGKWIERDTKIYRPSLALWNLLEQLIVRAPEVVSFDEFSTIFGQAESYDAHVKHIERLRDVMGDADDKTLIRNVRGRGYMFAGEPEVVNMTQSTEERNKSITHAEAQLLRWGPVDGKPPGICIDNCESGLFVPWNELKLEVEKKLLPQVRRVPMGSTVELRNLGDRKDWVVRILEPSGTEIGDVWFGPDADAKWRWDGLVRLGDSYRQSENERVVWQIFRRYSDGSYRRIEAIVIV